MAWHSCEVCGEDFWIGTPGRPPKRCEAHRNVKGATVVKSDPGMTPITDPVPLETLPNEVESADIHDEGKPNFYPGSCAYCGKYVAKMGGIRFQTNGKWHVRHTECEHIAGIPPLDEGSESETVEPSTASVTPSTVVAEVDPMLVRREVDRAITAFVNDTLPPMLETAMLAAGVVKHEFVVNGELAEVEGTTNLYFAEFMAMLTAGVPGKRLNIALPGPAGSGKSYMAVQAARALGLEIGIISFGPLTNTSKLFGYQDANGNYVSTPFRKIWEYGGLFLADEMDNAHPGLLAELNQALAGDIAAFADGMVPRHPEFRCVATMNTFGKGPDRLYAGRNQLDAATLNRFVMLEIGYDENLETKMALAFVNDTADEALIMRWVKYVQRVRAKADEAKLPIVFSPRNTEQGAMLLANGMAWEQVIDACLFASVSAEHRARLS